MWRSRSARSPGDQYPHVTRLWCGPAKGAEFSFAMSIIVIDAKQRRVIRAA
jgi:hypothetical protein